jgi:hypothetical protein
MPAKTFTTSKYEFSHGSKPCGRGGWIFAPQCHENGQAKWVSANGTYTEAKRQLPAGQWVVLP